MARIGFAARSILTAGLLAGVVFFAGCSDSGKRGTGPAGPDGPAITSLVPSRTVAGDTVVVEGTGFGTAPGVVVFPSSSGSVPAELAGSWSDTRIRALVPPGVANGPVKVQSGDRESNPVSFAVAAPRTFGADVLPLLQAGCSGCHAGPSPEQNLDATSREGLLRGGRRGPAVTPRHGPASLLVLKLRGQTSGDRMPRGGPYLSEDDILKISDWIDQGALPDAPPRAVSFAGDIEPLLEQHGCKGCHLGGPVVGNLDVSTYATLMRGDSNHGPVIQPGHGAESYLVRKLRGTAAGDRMPQGGPYLSEEEILLFSDWIDQGARDN